MEPVVCAVQTGSSSAAGCAAGHDALARYDDNGNGSITCAEARRHGIAPVRRSAASLPDAPGFLSWIAAHMIWLHSSILGILGLLVLFTAACVLDGKDTLAHVAVKDVPGVAIRLVVGDLLAFGAGKDALVVVGMNSAWDCALTSEGGRIAPQSLQGQITSQWFGGSGNLRAALERKTGGDLQRDSLAAPVPLGQAVRLDHEGRSVMWVTMSRWNRATRAYSATVPELEQAMGGLWDGLRASHILDEDVFCPVIGAAYGKIVDESPLTLLKRHIRSFVAATKEQKITATMTFVILPKDLRDMDLSDLRDFLTAECRRETLTGHHVFASGHRCRLSARLFAHPAHQCQHRPAVGFGAVVSSFPLEALPAHCVGEGVRALGAGVDVRGSHVGPLDGRDREVVHRGGPAEHSGVEVGPPGEYAPGSPQHRREVFMDLGPRARAFGAESVQGEPVDFP